MIYPASFESLLTPPEELAWRVARAQAAMASRGLDALFIYQNADLYYFSGTVQEGLLAVPVEGEPVFLVRRVVERARADSRLRRIVPAETPRAYAGLLAEQGIANLGRVGLEMDVLPAGIYLRQVKAFPGTEFVDASELVRMVRAVKRPWELDQMRRAAEIQDRMVRRLGEVLRPGMTEVEVASAMDAEGRRAGHQGLVRFRRFNQDVFIGHLMAGENAALPASNDAPTGGKGVTPALGNGAGHRPIGANEPILIDYNSCFNGYHSDQTRTASLGPLPEAMARAYAACREVLEGAQEWLRPGVTAGEVYARCIALAGRLGYADTFMGQGATQVPYVGHGVGIEMDELPVLARGSAVLLEAGMSIAVEPKIVFPGRGMVGVEDVFLIAEDGTRPLNLTSRDLLIL